MSIVIGVEDKATLLKGIESLGGQLTATIIGDENELSEAGELLHLLTSKAGRVLFNGFPTGVEVSDAMVHGGPFLQPVMHAELRWVRERLSVSCVRYVSKIHHKFYYPMH